MNDKNSTDSSIYTPSVHTPSVDNKASNKVFTDKEFAEMRKDFGAYCPLACPREMLPW